MTPFVQDADFTLLNCDVMDGLRTLPDESVHCVVTSPPYWGLRCYGVEGQLGLEATPDQYVTRIVEVFREVRRVLRSDGTLWLNLGDSYAQGHGGSSTEGNYTMRKAARGDANAPEKGDDRDPLTCDWCGWQALSYTALTDHVQGASGHGPDDYQHRTYRGKGGVRNVVPGLKPKDLVGAPWRVAFALQADGWYLRSDIIWAKPNPMPESVTDRPTKAHEYVFLLTRSPRYFFDQEAVREPQSELTFVKNGENATRTQGTKAEGADHSMVRGGAFDPKAFRLPHGRNLRSVWEIATQPYPEAHFATFPEALPDRCIRAGTSERGCCPECGAPWVREVKRESSWDARKDAGATRGNVAFGGNVGAGTQRGVHGNGVTHDLGGHVTTLGWRPTCACEPSSRLAVCPCGHNLSRHGQQSGCWDCECLRNRLDPVPCTVLDPFMGSGTTALVARKLGRRSIGIELSPEYAELCARRLQQQSLFAGDAA